MTGGYGDALLSVYAVGDGCGVYPAAGAAMPELVAGLGVQCEKVALDGPAEDEASRGGEDSGG